MKVLGKRDQIEALGATVVFVVHDDAVNIRQGMLRDLDVLFPVLVDLERGAYDAWGLHRSSVAGVWLDPRVWARYAVLLLHGSPLLRFGGDTLQLGGDFVVDREGRVTYARPQVRDDRPPVGELVNELASARASTTDRRGDGSA